MILYVCYINLHGVARSGVVRVEGVLADSVPFTYRDREHVWY